MYEGCSVSNACYFDIRDTRWWYDSRGWAFLSIFCYILSPCDRRQLRGSLTEWCLSQKCRWSKGMEMNSSMQQKNITHWHLWGDTCSCFFFFLLRAQPLFIAGKNANGGWLCWKIVFHSREFALSNCVQWRAKKMMKGLENLSFHLWGKAELPGSIQPWEKMTQRGSDQ